jgi:zinc protease
MLLKKRFGLTLATGFLLATLGTQAQYDWNQALPLNPKVVTGKLDNGIVYYFLPNAKPEKKVELRLILNSGSLSEDDNQLGLAHMAEHMAFNGTKNFKKNDIVSFLQDIGVGFGNDLNAYTSFDRTVYILPIPTDKPGNLEKGFQVLEDWAHNVTYITEDIEGERAIILEESRLGKGADDRMQQKWLPLYFNNNRFANRLPIGKDSIIKNFPPDAIRQYYRDWYRPDLMAVAVVGDINKDEALAMIKKHFSTIPVHKNPRPLPAIEFPAYTENKSIVLTDKEATSYGLQMVWPAMPGAQLKTFGDYKTSLIRNLFNAMLNARLREITQKPNPPFLFSVSYFDAFVRGYNQFGIQASTGTENPLKAAEAIIAEVERVKQFGFLASELERARKNLISTYENAYKNRDKTESGQLIEEFISLYLEGTAAPGIENEFDYVSKILPNISLADVNALADQLKGDQKKFLSITGPEAPANFTLPGNEELVNAVAKAEKAPVTAYEEAAIATNLLKKEPSPGKVLSKTKNAQTGATDLTLGNNITVSLKTTDFKNDEILMSASRYGGSSLYNETDLYSARNAGPIQGAMGYGDFNPTDLQKALSGKKVVAGGLIGPYKDEYVGNTTVKDMETMFQLLHLKVTSPRTDTALFNSFIKKQKSQTAMMMANPQTAFIDTLGKFIYNNNPFSPMSVPRAGDYDKVDLKRAQEIFRERMGDASGMHFVFVGSFKEEAIIPLIEKYIASLPSSGKKFKYVDRKVRPVKGMRNLEFNKGKEQKSLLLQIHSGEVPYTEDLELKTDALTEAMNIRIIEELREKVQGIYGGGIQGGLSKVPYASYNLTAVLPTGPEKVDTLIKALNTEIKKMQKNGPGQELLDKVKKQWLEAHREELKSNNAWAGALMASKVEGSNFDRFVNYEKYVNKLTPKDIQAVAQQLLSGKNMITAMQMPEKASTPTPPATVNGRTVAVAQTYEISDPNITLELYDNAEVDGDQVSIFANGTKVVDKKTLAAKPTTVTVKARRGENVIVMFAENLGSTPPNTAYMVIKSGDKQFKVELSSDLKQSAAIKLVLK